MDKITHEVRLANWKKIVERCQARPEGQTARQWLDDNGISSKSYYYWLRKIRKFAYDQSAGTNTAVSTVASEAVAPVSFAEIPFSVGSESSCGSDKSAFQPTAVVKTDRASIAFSNGATPELMTAIIREALKNA